MSSATNWDEERERWEDRIEQRPMEYHEQVRRNYLAQAEADPTYRLIAADRDVAAVHGDILHAVQSLRTRGE